MRRLGSILVLIAVVAAAVALSGPGGDKGGDARRYVVELDNAFGMVLGGDVRVAGVNAGQITDVDLDQRLERFLVQVDVHDLSRVHTSDAYVAAQHHPERVVELDDVAARIAAVTAGAAPGKDDGRQGGAYYDEG